MRNIETNVFGIINENHNTVHFVEIKSLVRWIVKSFGILEYAYLCVLCCSNLFMDLGLTPSPHLHVYCFM